MIIAIIASHAMRVARRLQWLLLVIVALSGCAGKQKNINQLARKAQRESISRKYPGIPRDEILQQIAGNKVYGELEERYRESMEALKTAADKDSVKMVIVIFTPETGKAVTPSNTYGIPYILQVCAQLNIDCINLTPDIAALQEMDLAQLPEDGNWSKAGAASAAVLLEQALKKYDSCHSHAVYPARGIPATFGDLPPKDDEIIDGEKNIPYHLLVNAQGLRMNHDLIFPKTKQTILFLGGTQLYSPYLDNDFIATSLLQKKMPGTEIVNAGNTGYTMDDYLSLYTERARYAQPDVLLVCTNGDDILNFFFSARNHFARADKCFEPSEVEKQFYEQIFN